MRFELIASVFTCLSIAVSAQAGSFEFGPQFAMSVPTGSAGDEMDLGPNAGMTATFMETPIVGVGVDLGYHHWPGSPDAEAAFDAMLSRLAGTQITGTKWTLSAFEVEAYGKAVAPISGPVAPWIRAGAGYYYIKGYLELLGRRGDDSELRFGYAGGVGFDVKTSGRMKFGLDATYHYLLWKNNSGVNFTAFTIGAHLLFARR